MSKSQIGANEDTVWVLEEALQWYASSRTWNQWCPESFAKRARAALDALAVTRKPIEAENAHLRVMLVEAGLSILSYHASCGMGSGDREAYDIALELGYEGPCSEEALSDWFREQVGL